VARLTDPEILSQYKAALSEWGCTGYIKWRRRAEDWVTANLAGQNTKAIAKLMWEHIEAGGEMDQVREQRPEYAASFEFHYDLRFSVGGYNLCGDGFAGDEHRPGNHRCECPPELTLDESDQTLSSWLRPMCDRDGVSRFCPPRSQRDPRRTTSCPLDRCSRRRPLLAVRGSLLYQ